MKAGDVKKIQAYYLLPLNATLATRLWMEGRFFLSVKAAASNRASTWWMRVGFLKNRFKHSSVSVKGNVMKVHLCRR
jgi:hypothetical protein